ncbi:MAG: cyclodeaminase/cyclohydrolase family protein [Deltaproteobacteria bacterium]|nr:cyclodeaminase/cyclohydrolase family protein [Deltaproteobacteria bacterium]
MLTDLSIKDLLAKTASKDPVPGGGSISALCAALAAALAEMVANLTIGKKGYEVHTYEMKDLAAEANRYREKLAQDIDRDSDAYAGVLSAFQLPKGTEEEKARRNEAVQQALKTAALVPLGVAEDAFRILDLAGKALEIGNRNAVTDAAIAAMSARTAVLGALYNVRINLVSIKDADFVKEVSEKVSHLEERAKEKEKAFLSRVRIE